VIKFALICVCPSIVTSASIGVLTVCVAGFAAWSNFGAIWMT